MHLIFYEFITRKNCAKPNQNFISKIKSKIDPSKRDKTWKNVNLIEFKKYIGILLMMGIDIKPEIDMHWQTYGMWSSNLIKSAMSRDRFLSINSF